MSDNKKVGKCERCQTDGEVILQMIIGSDDWVCYDCWRKRNQPIHKTYTKSDLVSFGNFLLSDRGNGNYLMSNKEVTHADLENWKELNKEK